MRGGIVFFRGDHQVIVCRVEGANKVEVKFRGSKGYQERNSEIQERVGNP